MTLLRRTMQYVTGKTYNTFAEWLADHPEPSLQELVERYGGYSRVPPEKTNTLKKPFLRNVLASLLRGRASA
jgi:hypothetical protein